LCCVAWCRAGEKEETDWGFTTESPRARHYAILAPW